MFIRKAAIEKIGLLDENLFFYNDDLDLCKRARKSGFKVVYFPGAEVFHYGGYSSKRSPNMKLFVEGFRGGLYFCKKHYGQLIYSTYRFILFVYVLAMLPFSLMNKGKLNAYSDILKIIINEQIVSKT